MAGETCKMILVVICVFMFMNTLVLGDLDLVNITLVDDAVQKGAVCLDGSPAGYHHAGGFGEGSSDWMVFLEGGGWCGQNFTCLDRAKGILGSTNNITFFNFTGILTSNQTLNPEFFNWNRVFVRYCDGSSFMGDAEDPQKKLHLRGARIFTAVVDNLLSKGMKTARNVILAGGSAGGLATILNCDRFRARVPMQAESNAFLILGFSFLRKKHLPGAESREDSFAKIVDFHGIAKSLPTSCTSRMNASLCFFPENVVGDIQTPLFLLNSAFDWYQIRQNLMPYGSDQTGWKENCTVNTPTLLNCAYSQFQLVQDFRTTFLETLKGTGDSPSRGEFVNSCYIHDFLQRENYWNGIPSVGNKTIAQAIGDWYLDRSCVKEIDDGAQNQNPLTCSIAPCC